DRGLPAAGAWHGQIDADGRLTTDRLPPGDYLLRLTTPPRGWTPVSAMVSGRDILDAPITIDPAGTAIDAVTVTYAAAPFANANGSVQDGQGHAAPGATVLIFPAERALWRDSTLQARRLRSVRATPSGKFGVPGLPPGDYVVTAIDGDVPAEW